MNHNAAKKLGRAGEWAKHLRPYTKRKAAKRVRQATKVRRLGDARSPSDRST